MEAILIGTLSAKQFQMFIAGCILAFVFLSFAECVSPGWHAAVKDDAAQAGLLSK
jgi:hypothetical protein